MLGLYQVGLNIIYCKPVAGCLHVTGGGWSIVWSSRRHLPTMKHTCMILKQSEVFVHNLKLQESMLTSTLMLISHTHAECMKAQTRTRSRVGQCSLRHTSPRCNCLQNVDQRTRSPCHVSKSAEISLPLSPTPLLAFLLLALTTVVNSYFTFIMSPVL